jgi:hypothetical protein
MKIAVFVCVLMLAVPAAQAGVVETGVFEEARRVGEAHERSFFLFSTSVGHYAIRHDGMGEVSVNARRRVFFLKVAGRIKRIYFQEHQGDLVVLYEVSDGTGYVGRMNQRSRKMRWLTQIKVKDIASCVVEGEEAHCGDADELTKIDLNSGSRSN